MNQLLYATAVGLEPYVFIGEFIFAEATGCEHGGPEALHPACCDLDTPFCVRLSSLLVSPLLASRPPVIATRLLLLAAAEPNTAGRYLLLQGDSRTMMPRTVTTCGTTISTSQAPTGSVRRMFLVGHCARSR